jgi:hypothetical protein
VIRINLSKQLILYTIETSRGNCQHILSSPGILPTILEDKECKIIESTSDLDEIITLLNEQYNGVAALTTELGLD